MLVPLSVFVLIIFLYYEMVTGNLSRYLKSRKRAKVNRKKLEAIEKAHKIADKAIMEGIPKEEVEPKKIKCGNSTIDVEEIYDALLEAHIRDV